MAYEDDFDEYLAEAYAELEEYEKDNIPECCLACGGDYPLCRQGCSLFDDE